MVSNDSTTNRTENLQSYFEKSAAAVTRLFDQFDRTYIQPGAAQVNKSFSEQPVRATFLGTFAVLSFLPVFSFVGFSIFAIGACTFIALAAALVVSTAAIAFVGFWLGLTLVFLLFTSLCITNALLCTYLFLRYVTRVREGGLRAGSAQWARELKSRVVGGGMIKAEPVAEETLTTIQERKTKEEIYEDSDGSGVDDTTVVIDEDSPDQRFSSKELDGRESPVFVKRESEHVVTAVVKQPEVVDAL